MTQPDVDETAVQVTPGDGASPVIVVCEHASRFIPAEYGGLGLQEDAQRSHIAWDPGAEAVAEHMAQLMGAALVASRVSRLVYDCNRPPEAHDAMPAISEAYEIPGNANLSPDQRARRTARCYTPFRNALGAQVKATPSPVLITIHSFTPVYNGVPRAVEIGVLHDTDSRLADAFLATAADYTTMRVERNAPYGPEHGVTHTLQVHALPKGHLNVMLEIRNDLIATSRDQHDMAQTLVNWTRGALATLGTPLGEPSCRA